MTAERLDPAEVEAFRRARAEVLDRIDVAAARAGLDSQLVTLVAVTKTVPADRVRAAVVAGFRVLGENRVQEGAAKIPLVDGAAWHLIGPLQSNKARRAVELFDMIESVHTLELAERLAAVAAEDRPGRLLPVLLQVNVDRDPAKAGFDPDTIEATLDRLDDLAALDFRGLMTIGRFAVTAVEARTTFAALRDVGERLRARWPRLGSELSMGMSDDYEIAVEEGATIVRVGRAIFGERPAVPGGRSPPSVSLGLRGGSLLDSGHGLSRGLRRHAAVPDVAPRAWQGAAELGRSGRIQPGLAVPDPGHGAVARPGAPGPASRRDVRLLGPACPDRPGRPLARVPLSPTETRFSVRLTPRGGADRVDGVLDGVLRARVAAPPVEGAANEALLRLLADELRVPRRDVRLVAGAGGRTKVVVVDGLRPDRVAERWPGLRL
jgi:pyridoxal phosphate enzyme (YggS family)